MALRSRLARLLGHGEFVGLRSLALQDGRLLRRVGVHWLGRKLSTKLLLCLRLLGLLGLLELLLLLLLRLLMLLMLLRPL